MYYLEHEGKYYTPYGQVDKPLMSNEALSQLEVEEFRKAKPAAYFAYVDMKRLAITTWMGDILGYITSVGRRYKSNMGDERRSISATGINGVEYYGTYYCGTGDYARLKARKK